MYYCLDMEIKKCMMTRLQNLSQRVKIELNPYPENYHFSKPPTLTSFLSYLGPFD